MEKISIASIRHNGIYYTGYRHHLIGLKMLEDNILEKPYPGGDDQAFLTDTGRWVSREEALIIAVNAGQLDMANKKGNRKQLFSEDLWTMDGTPL